MIVEHRGKRIYVLGDTHLGRSFVNNVPLHRRGDREGMVWHQFYRELGEFDASCDYHIHMGDLFDKAQVGHMGDLQAATADLAAARRNPDVQFVILQGNHDASRDLQINTAFGTFSMIVESVPNIHIIRGWNTSLIPGVGLFGWLPFQSATEMVNDNTSSYELAFGHWDTDLRVDPFNLIPTMFLRERGVTRAYPGHVHLPDQFSCDGVDVTQMGSMQPYAHGEDADGTWYVTLGLNEALERDDLHNKCVRIELKPGAIFDTQIDCLQLQVRQPEQVEADNYEVTLGEFIMMGLFDELQLEIPLLDPMAKEMRLRCEQFFTPQACPSTFAKSSLSVSRSNFSRRCSALRTPASTGTRSAVRWPRATSLKRS
jgi:hypothetical protein